LSTHDRQDSASDVHRAAEVDRQLPVDLLGRHLLEVSLVRHARVVDEHVVAKVT
jgi:hypothetical protein